MVVNAADRGGLKWRDQTAERIGAAVLIPLPRIGIVVHFPIVSTAGRTGVRPYSHCLRFGQVHPNSQNGVEMVRHQDKFIEVNVRTNQRCPQLYFLNELTQRQQINEIP